MRLPWHIKSKYCIRSEIRYKIHYLVSELDNADFERKTQSKQACLGVVGLGYIGLLLAVEEAKAGFKTIGFDVQHEKYYFKRKY